MRRKLVLPLLLLHMRENQRYSSSLLYTVRQSAAPSSVLWSIDCLHILVHAFEHDIIWRTSNDRYKTHICPLKSLLWNNIAHEKKKPTKKDAEILGVGIPIFPFDKQLSVFHFHTKSAPTQCNTNVFSQNVWNKKRQPSNKSWKRRRAKNRCNCHWLCIIAAVECSPNHLSNWSLIQMYFNIIKYPVIFVTLCMSCLYAVEYVTHALLCTVLAILILIVQPLHRHFSLCLAAVRSIQK